MDIKFKLFDPLCAPTKASITDACFDVFAAEDTGDIPAFYTRIVKAGFALDLPSGWEARIRGRSGLASKGIMVHAGTIDETYNKEVGVIITNVTKNPISIRKGHRIAQLTFAEVPQIKLVEAEFADSGRGGFGSTGQ